MAGDQQVVKLRETLRALGFALVGESADSDGVKTRLALREFQAYARIARTAKLKAGTASARWIERLEPVDNTFHPPFPPITGELDAAGNTQRALDHWVAQTYRCPLVIEARVIGASDFQPLLANVWDYGDPGFVIVQTAVKKKTGKTPSFEFRVADFTRTTSPATAWELMPLVGSREPGFGWGGKPRRSAPPALTLECTPKTALAKDWFALSAEQQVTFRVIRAVAEQECIGFFDALNSYDTAIMSMGPCHWTMTLRLTGKDGSTIGELPPFLAYAIGREPNLQMQEFDPFGLQPQYAWPPGTAGQLYKGSWEETRNYTGRMSWTTNSGRVPIEKYSELNWFRTPHWYWRFVEMARRHPVLLTSEWDMARVRLRDLLTTKVGGSGTYKDRQLSEIFTSPLACALVLRFHIRSSGFAAPINDYPSQIIARAGVTGTPSTWEDSQEKLLIDSLIAHAVRRSYPVSTIPRPDMGQKPTLAELLEHGKTVEKRLGIHKDALAMQAWPDKDVFEVAGLPLGSRCAGRTQQQTQRLQEGL